jgi:hypothetical protein
VDLAVVAARSADLARELTLAGARTLVVGSTARRLRGGASVTPRDLDLDVVVDADEVRRLTVALRRLRVDGVVRQKGGTVPTGWCPLDVFVGPPPAAVGVVVGGVPVAVFGG